MISRSLSYKFAPLAMFFIMAFGYSRTINPSHQKKIHKEMLALWPNSSIEMEEILLNESERSEATKIGIQKIYALKSNEEKLGYLVYLFVPSKFDYFDLGLIYDRDSKIKSMKVLAYREDHGGEVGSKRWLKQFIGLGEENPMVLNDDIQGISGATISCESATKGARETTIFLNQLNQEN